MRGHTKGVIKRSNLETPAATEGSKCKGGVVVYGQMSKLYHPFEDDRIWVKDKKKASDFSDAFYFKLLMRIAGLEPARPLMATSPSS